MLSAETSQTPPSDSLCAKWFASASSSTRRPSAEALESWTIGGCQIGKPCGPSTSPAGRSRPPVTSTLPRSRGSKAKTPSPKSNRDTRHRSTFSKTRVKNEWQWIESLRKIGQMGPDLGFRKWGLSCIQPIVDSLVEGRTCQLNIKFLQVFLQFKLQMFTHNISFCQTLIYCNVHSYDS